MASLLIPNDEKFVWVVGDRSPNKLKATLAPSALLHTPFGDSIRRGLRLVRFITTFTSNRLHPPDQVVGMPVIYYLSLCWANPTNFTNFIHRHWIVRPQRWLRKFNVDPATLSPVKPTHPPTPPTPHPTSKRVHGFSGLSIHSAFFEWADEESYSLQHLFKCPT